jgi:uncharacterized damage-inducible protein DinB
MEKLDLRNPDLKGVGGELESAHAILAHSHGACILSNHPDYPERVRSNMQGQIPVQIGARILEASEILIDAYTRIQELVHRSTEGLTQKQLTYRPEEGSNSIAWLVWHLTRIQDGHLAAATGNDEAWMTDGWAEKFGLPAELSVNGQGDGPAEVAALRPHDPDVLLGYHDAVVERTRAYLRTVDSAELDRIIDRSYDPPVSVGVRLVSVISDNSQHAGQARYLNGMIGRLVE